MELPSIRQLECFRSVADTLSFRRAAELSFMSQSALSTHIKNLETLLGVRLFERSRRGVLLTPAGERLLDSARGILVSAQELVESAAAFATPLSGTIRLGVIPTVAPYFLPTALRIVRRRFPRLRTLIHEDQTSRLVEKLRLGELDLLLVALEADLGDVETLPLFRDEFWLAVPEGHPLATRRRLHMHDLGQETVLLLDEGHCFRDQALALCSANKANEFGDFRASSLGTLVQTVVGGIGVTLLPDMALDVEVHRDSQLTVLPFTRPRPGRTIGLAWRKSSLRRKEFELLAEAFGGRQLK